MIKNTENVIDGRKIFEQEEAEKLIDMEEVALMRLIKLLLAEVSAVLMSVAKVFKEIFCRLSKVQPS